MLQIAHTWPRKNEKKKRKGKKRKTQHETVNGKSIKSEVFFFFASNPKLAIPTKAVIYLLSKERVQFVAFPYFFPSPLLLE